MHGSITVSIPAAMESDIRAGAMKMIVFEELVYQEALRRKMTIAPARLQRAEADFGSSLPARGISGIAEEGIQRLEESCCESKIERSLLIERC